MRARPQGTEENKPKINNAVTLCSLNKTQGGSQQPFQDPRQKDVPKYLGFPTERGRLVKIYCPKNSASSCAKVRYLLNSSTVGKSFI